MSTSLAEQLRRLQTPQTSQFVDSRKRDSILFTAKEAATKSRETIYEIGISGLHELIELNPIFMDFQSTLFEPTSKDIQRAVETKEVNALLNKNIKSFMFHASPYFMIPATHKCLEWLIRRFNINLYNKEEFLMLILPYHQTNMFVRCIQSMKFDDPSDKFGFLSDVKTSSAPLSKYALWNHGATQPSFLGFVGKFTFDAIKELESKAGSLQTMMAFYCTTTIGAMEHAAVINDNHILAVVKYLAKAYKSNVIDYAAAGYMITAQLLVKTKLGLPLLNQLMDKITSSYQLPLSQNVILLMSLMFQSQTEELVLTEKSLENIMGFKWLPSALDQMKNEGKPFISFYKALICKLLEKIGEKDENFMIYRDYCEAVMKEVSLEDDEAQIIIRSILDSYTHVPDETEAAVEPMPMVEKDIDEIISLDSDDEEENIPLKSQDVTLWYSAFLKSLERSYPLAFDEVVKDVMSQTPGRRRNGLKNVLGFLLKVSCANSDTNIFENLYHHNPQIRTEAVAYLVQNFNKINLIDNDNADILKLTIAERLNDENPNVFLEVLNIKTSQLLELIGADELVAKLSKALMRFWKSPEKWSMVCNKALQVLTSDGVYQCSDPNIVLISVLPFLFASEDRSTAEAYHIIKESKYGKSSNFIKSLPKKLGEKSSIVVEALETSKNLPSSLSLLSTIENSLLDSQKTGSVSAQFAFFLLAHSIEEDRSPDFSLNVVLKAKEVLVKRKFLLVNGEATDTKLIKRQELPAQAVTMLFKKVISNTAFVGPAIDFNQQDSEMKLKIELFQFLVEKFFSAPASDRSIFNEVIKTFLDKVCKSDHLTKLQFFSQFCASHSVHQDDDGTSLELQIRAMRLLTHVLSNNQEHSKDYPNELFQNILIALSAEQAIVREFSVQLVETLHVQKIPACWKFLFEKLESRKSEILMDSEQLSLILFLVGNKKSSVHMKTIMESITATIEGPSTFDYIRSSLLMILKHLNDKKILDVMTEIALKMVEGSGDEVQRFDDYQSSIIKLVLMKINQSTITSLWKLAMASLKCHRLLFDEDGKYLTPSVLVLKALDEETFAKLHPDHRHEIFLKIVKCSMNENPKIVAASHKIFQSVEIDSKFVTSVLLSMPKLEQPLLGKKRRTVGGQENPLVSEEWKTGVTLLELMQNKSKGLTNQHEMIPLLFDVLDNCLRSPTESSVEYTRQIVLSLLLNICQQVSPDGKSHRAKGIQESMLKTELVIRCIKESENPQTHHHSLLLLAQLALMTPEQVLNDMMTIFTFVGTTLIRHEDSYSFQIISKIIENVVPTLAHGKRGDDDVIPILKIFASIVLQVPEHRRLLLFVKLLSTLNVDKFLWMFVGLVLESQVMNHQKGSVQEELPQRVQAALAIAKEFEIKTILESATALLSYIKELPMFLENKAGARTSLADEATVIFSLKTHTDVQLRHYKYLMLQFMKNLLSSPEVQGKVAKLDQSSKMEMKGLFQDIILNVLTLIPEISKALDHQKMKPFEKSWQAILQNSFDILEAAIELLAPDMLLVVVENLMLHDFLLVRKKVIELLNRKMEEKYFETCDEKKLLKLMNPLKTICNTIGNGDVNTALEVVQQSALISIKLLARKLSEDYPEEFIEILELLTNVIDNEKIKTAVMVNLVICIAELTADLKVQAIGMIGKFMPSILRLMTVRDDDPAAFLLLYSVVSSVLRVIETIPLFLSPYLTQIISQLARLSPGLKMLQDGKITMTVAKISKIWTTMAQLVPTRVLVPAIEEVYEKIVQKELYTSIEPLMELLVELFKNVEGKEVKAHQSELTQFFLIAMDFRCKVEGIDTIDFHKINDIEIFIIQALVALVMKLSEGSFRPLFESVSIWALRDEPDNYNRAITFFRLTNEVSMALKSLFLLFASELVDSAGPMLDKCNPAKHDDDSCFGDDKKKNLYLTEFILKTMSNIFLNDHQNFINTQRFDVIMQPIVDQIENEFVLHDENIQQLVRTCVAQLATAASDDILWKQLNYQVLMKTRSDNPEQRIFGVKVCVDMAKKLGEDFEPLVPETIPFLSELLEDEDYKVVEACQNGVRELETTVGESLQKYF